jgi:acetyl esterase/lipase
MIAIGRSIAGIAVLVAGLGASPTPAPAQDQPPVTTAFDLVYSQVGDRELKLDLARPAQGDGPFPAVIVIHGGAWRSGDKSQNRAMLERLARHGYVAISPQYRFCPKDLFPAQVLDVKAAVRWLKQQADEQHVDPHRIGAMGFSAGGHLALMLGLTDGDDGFDTNAPAGAPDTRVQAVVNYFGPTDLAAKDIPEVSLPLVRDFLGGSAAEKPEVARQASPLTYVTSDDPPVLTFQGTRDPLVPYTQALELAESLTTAGGKGRVELILGGGHGNDWGARELERTFDQTLAFFDAVLKPSQ